LVNYRVGGAAQRDVWEHLPSWSVDVGHVAVFSTKNEKSPWFLGTVLEVISDGKNLHGIDGETFVVHEMGNEKRSNAVSEPVNLIERARGANEGNWNYRKKHYYRYQEHTRRNGTQDVFKKKLSNSEKLIPVRTAVGRDTLAYWGPSDKILKTKMELRKDVLVELSKNPNVLWTMSEVSQTSKKSKKK